MSYQSQIGKEKKKGQNSEISRSDTHILNYCQHLKTSYLSKTSKISHIKMW